MLIEFFAPFTGCAVQIPAHQLDMAGTPLSTGRLSIHFRLRYGDKPQAFWNTACLIIK